MALSINDVITLAQAGFSKSDIAAFMNLGSPQTTPPAVPPAQQAAPVAPVTTPPVPAQTAAPVQPDYGAQIAALSQQVAALSVPTAGTVGNPPTVTSVEDIIKGAFLPRQAESAPANQ